MIPPNIVTTRIYANEWMAIDDDTFDGVKPCGTGETEQEAIDDLLEQIANSIDVRLVV